MKRVMATAVLMLAMLPALSLPAKADGLCAPHHQKKHAPKHVKRTCARRVHRRLYRVAQVPVFKHVQRRLIEGGIACRTAFFPARLAFTDWDFYLGQTLNPTVGTYGPAFTGNNYPELVASPRDWIGYYSNGWE